MGACLTLQHQDSLYARSCHRDVTMLSPSPHLCPPDEGLQPQAGSARHQRAKRHRVAKPAPVVLWRNKMCLFSLLKWNVFRSQDHQGSEVLCHDFVPLVLVHWNISPTAGTAELQTRWQLPGCTLNQGRNDIWIRKIIEKWKFEEKNSQSEFWDCNLSQLLLSYDGSWARMADRCSLRQETPLGLWFKATMPGDAVSFLILQFCYFAFQMQGHGL